MRPYACTHMAVDRTRPRAGGRPCVRHAVDCPDARCAAARLIPAAERLLLHRGAPRTDDGGGFAVLDGHGARLWTAFQAAGGVDALGYPVSRRFELEGGVAQAFEHGVLRWDPASNQVRYARTPGATARRTPARQTNRRARRPRPRRSPGPAGGGPHLTAPARRCTPRTGRSTSTTATSAWSPVRTRARGRGNASCCTSRAPRGPATATASPRPRCSSPSRPSHARSSASPSRSPT